MSGTQIILMLGVAAALIVASDGCNSVNGGGSLPSVRAAEVVDINILSQKDGRTAVVAKREYETWCDAINSASEVRRIQGQLTLKPHYVVKVRRGDGILLFGCNDDGTGVYRGPGATRWELKMNCPRLLEIIRSLLASSKASEPTTM